MPREIAEPFFCVITYPQNMFSIAAGVRDRSARYAATTRAVYEACALMARRLQQPEQDVYRGVKFLVNSDPAWQAILQPDAQMGTSITTNGIVTCWQATAQHFPNDEGLFELMQGLRPKMEDSDIVCLRSAPTDAEGHHSVVASSDNDVRFLPPMSTVTLMSVQEPGEWQVRGIRVKRRLYTVSVSYRL